MFYDHCDLSIIVEVRSLVVHETLPCVSATPVFACKVGVGVHDRQPLYVFVDPVR